jgi:hypothetical protein
LQVLHYGGSKKSLSKAEHLKNMVNRESTAHDEKTEIISLQVYFFCIRITWGEHASDKPCQGQGIQRPDSVILPG